jgi:hypothetical protein
VLALGALGAGSALAAHGLIVVTPASPVMGTPVTVEVRTPAKLRQPVELVARGATASVRARLRPVVPHHWHATLTFPKPGSWTLRVAGLSTAVVVQPPPESTFAPPGALGCAPPSPANAVTGEILGTNGLWALVGTLDVVAGRQTKIILKLGGSGDPTFVALAPDRTRVMPDEMQPHAASTWLRPGDEWGSGWTFPQPGCWDLHAERGGVASDLWLVVR